MLIHPLTPAPVCRATATEVPKTFAVRTSKFIRRKYTQVAIVGLILAGAGVSAYLWNLSEFGEEVDPLIANARETYTCLKCRAEFEFSVADATRLYRREQKVTCPSCGGTAEKANPVYDLGGGTAIHRSDGVAIPTSSPAEKALQD